MKQMIMKLTVTLAILAWTMWQAEATIVPMVTHSTAGTLFSEGFESQIVGAVGGPTTALIDPGVPGGFTETWTVTENTDTPPHTVRTRDASSDVALDAHEGSKYVRINRAADQTTQLEGTFATQSSGTFTLRFAAYVPSVQPSDNDSGAKMLVRFGGEAGNNLGMQFFTIDDGSLNKIVYAATSGTTDTGLFYTPDVWQKYTVTYYLIAGAANDVFDLTVDGNTVTGLDAAADLTDVRTFHFRGGGGGAEFFVDAQFSLVPVPEASTALLLGLGGLLVWRRRK